MTATLPAPCDSALLDRPEARPMSHPRWTLVATILASSLAFIDGSASVMRSRIDAVSSRTLSIRLRSLHSDSGRQFLQCS